MSPRHSARPDRRTSLRRRLVTAAVVLVAGAAGIIAAGGWLAHPARPRLSPTVSYPAMLDRNGGPGRTDADRGAAVSRSSARGASSRTTAPPAPTTATTPIPSSRPTPARSTPGTPGPTRSPSAVPDPSYLQRVLDLTNAQRTKAGCPPLRMDPRLHQAAQAHTQDMADRDYFSHTGSDGSSPWDRAKAAGYPDPSGENIALGYSTPAAVMDAWMASPGHRANILNCDSRDLGVGYVRDPGRGALWTQLFGFG